MDSVTQADGRKIGSLSASPREAFLHLSRDRLQHLVELLAVKGSCVVLTGEPGSGKGYLAHAAAYAIQQHAGSMTHVPVCDLREFTELQGTETELSAREAALALVEKLRAGKRKRKLIVTALNIDAYDPGEAAVLEHLVRQHRLRLIATARTVSGAADRLAREPSVHQVPVEPLDRRECEALLSKLLGVDSIAPATLRRWYAASAGNPHALTTLAVAAERRGVVQRTRRVAWIPARDDTPPADFIAQLGPLTPQQRNVLELLTFAAPLHEPALLHLLDAEAVTSLIESHVLDVHTDDQGITALTTRLPVLADAMRWHLSPLRRTELAQQCYEALAAEDGTLNTASRARLVRFGIEAGQPLPVDWIWQAMHASAGTGDLRFGLRLALAAMPHERPVRAAEAMLRACDLAYFLGDRDGLNEAIDAISQLLADDARMAQLPFETQFALAATAISCDPRYRCDADGALDAFHHWQQRWGEQGVDARRISQTCRMRMLCWHGRLREALAEGGRIDEPHNLYAEWLSAPARSYEAIIRLQRGEIRKALSLAETTRQIILLREISPTISGDLEGFLIFLANWARGTTISAGRAIDLLGSVTRADLAAVHANAGLVETASALFALQEARWHDAAEVSAQLLPSLEKNDPFGIAPLVHAVSALALAALGDRSGAHNALHHTERFVPGVSQALRGIVGVLSIRARHWMRDPDLPAQARALVSWAREEELALIELEAIDVLAHATGTLDGAMFERAAQLAPLVDGPIGEAILAHVQALTRRVSGPIAPAEPEERLLSELGIWVPLPPVALLTGREREIALFTALGYSSKHIAARLHLSARTIETHLAHIYGKLGVSGRAQLRDWFSRRREAV